MKEFVLGIDIGSSSVKLTLLGNDGLISGSTGCEYPTAYPKPGWCEQNPEDWCCAFRKALADMFARTGVLPEQIKAVAPDAATHTAVLLNSNRNVLRPAILWTDQRSKEQVERLRNNYPEVIRKQSLNTPTTVWTLPQLMWIQQQEPDTWQKIQYILFAKDYLRFRLTGILATDHIDAAGSMFYDVRNRCWSKELCTIGGIKEAWLPKLLDPSEIAGYVTEEAAVEFGLAYGTAVLTGTTDTAMEVLAAGSVAPGHATVKLATAGRICVISNEMLDSPFVFNYRHVVPGLWYPGTGTASCANSYRWYRDALGKADYESLNSAAGEISPGCEGLMFHPYLNGELTPYNDPLLRGSYTGISSMHTDAHFTRATLEGVAFSLLDCLHTLQELGVKMSRVRIIGGGAKGTLWRQIVSDVLGLTLEKAKVDDSSFGSAMLAAVGIGWYENYAQAAEACIQIDTITTPNMKNTILYEQIFVRYKSIHDALAPIYHNEQK